MLKTPDISVIIPVRNEALTLPGLLRSLARQDGIEHCQVIVVDGQSRDETTTKAMSFPFVEVVECEPGRARQMNVGAARAAGKNLWFLHADSTLPTSDCLRLIMLALEDARLAGGAFRFRLRGDDWYFQVVNALVNFRAKVLHRPYGDQGIFVRAPLFRDLGGYRALDSCEDLDLALRMRRRGGFRIVDGTVETSARTWQSQGKLKVTGWHLAQILSYEWRRLTGALGSVGSAGGLQAALPKAQVEPPAAEVPPESSQPATEAVTSPQPPAEPAAAESAESR